MGIWLDFPAAKASGAVAGGFCAWGWAMGGAQRCDASRGRGGQRLTANPS